MENGDALGKVLLGAFQETLKHCVPARTCREILGLAADVEARSQAMSPSIRRNPAYEEFLVSLDLLRSRVSTWTEEEAKNPARRHVIRDRVVTLLQKSGTRNTIAAIQLNRLARTGLRRKKTDRFILSPKEQLRYALDAEETCQNRGIPGSEQGYQAGFHYDILNAVFNARKAPADAKTGLKNAWTEGLRTARVASSLVGNLKSFRHHSLVFPAALLCPIGKPLMAIYFPLELAEASWVKFLSQCERHGENQYLALWTMQARRYPVVDAELAGLVASFVGLFPELEPVLTHQRDFNWLKARDRELSRLAGLVSVSNAVVLKSRLNPLQLDCLRDLGLDAGRLERVAAEALKEEE